MHTADLGIIEDTYHTFKSGSVLLLDKAVKEESNLENVEELKEICRLFSSAADVAKLSSMGLNKLGLVSNSWVKISGNVGKEIGSWSGHIFLSLISMYKSAPKVLSTIKKLCKEGLTAQELKKFVISFSFFAANTLTILSFAAKISLISLGAAAFSIQLAAIVFTLTATSMVALDFYRTFHEKMQKTDLGQMKQEVSSLYLQKQKYKKMVPLVFSFEQRFSGLELIEKASERKLKSEDFKPLEKKLQKRIDLARKNLAALQAEKIHSKKAQKLKDALAVYEEALKDIRTFQKINPNLSEDKLQKDMEAKLENIQSIAQEIMKHKATSVALRDDIKSKKILSQERLAALQTKLDRKKDKIKSLIKKKEKEIAAFEKEVQCYPIEMTRKLLSVTSSFVKFSFALEIIRLSAEVQDLVKTFISLFATGAYLQSKSMKGRSILSLKTA